MADLQSTLGYSPQAVTACPGHQEGRPLQILQQLPLTMGGGIGQSRLCMLLLGKAHIGEVQVSLWDAETKAVCERAGVQLL